MSCYRFLLRVPLCLCFLVIPERVDAAEKVRMWEGAITLPTYPWRESVYPEFAELTGRIVYPYPMQDHLLKTPVDRKYRALFLENEYLRVTCIPELGGRIHSVVDKTEDAEMFHRNDAIKPALIAMRGAWISGGIEWNTGPQGHTVTAVSPVTCVLVRNGDGSASLVVGNTEKIFRTRWTIRLTLHPGRAYLDERIRIFNPTDGVHPYYFWNCTAFPCRRGTRFMFPMTLGTDHAGTSFFSWPTHEGRDLTYLKNYQTMTSIFAYRCDFDFFGAYDTDSDRGLVGYANHHELKGKKAWTWGQDDFGIVSQMSLSDAGRKGAPYIEVQSGPLLTQADFGMLRPRQEMSWQEWWYPVHGLGRGFEFATRDVAIETIRSGGDLELRVIATSVFPEARVTLGRGGSVLVERALDLSPAAARSVRLDSPAGEPVDVAIRSGDGKLLAAYTTPLAIPVVEPPDLAEKRARPDGRLTPDEIWHKGFTLDSQTKPAQARAKYEEALREDPLHGPSLRSLAVLDLEAGLYDEAARRLERALERDPDDGMAWYYLGVVHLKRDRFAEARRCGYRAAFTRDAISAGYDLVGRAEMRAERYGPAVQAFEKALASNPLDTRTRTHGLMARYASGDIDGAAKEARRLVRSGDPTDMLPRALLALADDAKMQRFLRDFRRSVGEPQFVLLEVALAFAELGLFEEAEKLLDAYRRSVASDEAGSLVYYYLAWLAFRAGNAEGARAHLETAAGLSSDDVLPSRPETIEVLERAIRLNPADAKAHLILGNLLAGLHRLEEALPHWREAARLDSSLSVAFRNLGLNAWKKKDDLSKAEEAYRSAVAARPEDQRLYFELVQIMASRDKRVEAMKLVAPLAAKGHLRADLLLWLAQAYVDEKRWDDALDLLTAARFSSWEGGTRPHDIFARAHIERGKMRLENEANDRALEDFSAALTYPANLEVGRPYNAAEAEAYYWKGRALEALGRSSEARTAWETGAAGAKGSKRQNEYRRLCARQAGREDSAGR